MSDTENQSLAPDLPSTKAATREGSLLGDEEELDLHLDEKYNDNLKTQKLIMAPSLLTNQHGLAFGVDSVKLIFESPKTDDGLRGSVASVSSINETDAKNSNHDLHDISKDENDETRMSMTMDLNAKKKDLPPGLKRISVQCIQVNVEPYVHEKITAVVSTSKLMILGTLCGSIHILSIKGDEFGTVQWHQSKINSITLGADQTVALSCSEDGRVAVIDTFEGKAMLMQQVDDENITAAALPPKFRENQFYLICTTNPDRSVCICRKSAFSMFGSTQVSCERFAPWTPQKADNVKYDASGMFVAWASPEGVYVVETKTRNLITLLPPPKNINKSTALLFPCHLAWIRSSDGNKELAIAWGNSVQLLSVKESEVDVMNEIGESVGKEKETFVRVNSSFELEKSSIIAGITSHKGSDVVLLVLNSNQRDKASILLTDWTGKIDKSAQLPAVGAVSFSDLSMSPCVYSNFTSICHIVCGSQAYLLEIRDVDDEIEYLLSHQKYKEALQQAKIWSDAGFLRAQSYEKVAEQYLNALWKIGEMEKFGKILIKAGKVKPELWKTFVDRLMERKELHLIVEQIPVKRPRLEKKFYDRILKYFLAEDPELFVKILHSWPAKIFHASELLKKVEKDMHKRKEHQKSLQEAQTALLIACGKLDSAFNAYLTSTQSVMEPFVLHRSNTATSQESVGVNK